LQELGLFFGISFNLQRFGGP